MNVATFGMCWRPVKATILSISTLALLSALPLHAQETLPAGEGGAVVLDLRDAPGPVSDSAQAAASSPTASGAHVLSVTAFKQALAEGVGGDAVLSAFYRDREYRPVWTGSEDGERLASFIDALEGAPTFGLPASRYDAAGLRARLAQLRGDRDRGRAEVEITRLFLKFAREMQTGILTPSSIDATMVRKVVLRDPRKTLDEFVAGTPRAFLRRLPPQHPEYARLLKEKRVLEDTVASGGWGSAVSARMIRPGERGPKVVELRNRMMRMGYLGRSALDTYDVALSEAVKRFQLDHDLVADGVAGPNTINEINAGPERRLEQILVALERRRWLNQPLGARHILVNLAEFRTYVVDDGKVSFTTRSVIGKNTSDRRTPEFSDMMTHMVINPTWNVPRSITTKEYLPKLKQNRNAVGNLVLVDSAGRAVNRNNVNFSAYTARNFPFRMKQPPSPSNALGRVKFMFPNKYAIYLHDTPAKSLFSREVRDFSHGCVRLADPFEFAYTLLRPQQPDEKAYFQRILRSERETRVNLKPAVPVHLVYRTAFSPARGQMNYRRDIYGRDAEIFSALVRAGVVLPGIQS